MLYRYIFIVCLACSCRKFVQVELPPDQSRAETVFADAANALAAASQVYVNMREPSDIFSNSGMTVFASLYSDEIYNTFSIDVYDAYALNALTSQDATVFSSFWSAAYKNIYCINAVLEGLEGAAFGDRVKNQLTGEMKTVRAWYYFYLVNLFGDVPLVKTTLYSDNALLARSPVTDIYEFMVTDLREAVALLEENYPSEGRGRPNKWTAMALLARVQLYRGEWEDAAANAAAVINAGMYNLVTEIDQVFRRDSPETIWEVAPVADRGNNAAAAYFVPYAGNTVPFIAVTNSLLDAFEPGDLRKAHWLGKNTVTDPAPADYYYPFKFRAVTAEPVEEYNTILRYDEILLIRAEALLRLGRPEEATGDINSIRQRAGLAEVGGLSEEELFGLLMRERRVELFTEWGHRWFDLARWGLLHETMTASKGANWQAEDALFPVPYNELLYNPSLVQNPGY